MLVEKLAAKISHGRTLTPRAASTQDSSVELASVALAIEGQDLLDWGPLAISVLALLVAIGAVVLPYRRRPSLSLLEDTERTHSRVEGDEIPYLRLLVRNAKGKRSAKYARAVLDGYREAGSTEPFTRLGSPFLGWPSVGGQDSNSYVSVVFSDAARPVGLGRFSRVRVNPDNGLREREERYRQDVGAVSVVTTTEPASVIHFPDPVAAPEGRWHLHLELADDGELTDERDWLTPGAWTIRLIVGADDGDAHAYEVDLAWAGDESDAATLLSSALNRLEVRRA
jgi:hypothetical protein